MDYELRIVVEKVSVSSQEVIKRDTLKVYNVKAPTSILELRLRHEEQISLLEKVQNSVLAAQSKLSDTGIDVCPKCGGKLIKKGLGLRRDVILLANCLKLSGILDLSRLLQRKNSDL